MSVPASSPGPGSSPTSNAAALSAFLFDLHERSNELGYRELQAFALSRLAELIRFDAGLFAIGTIQNGVPMSHDVVLRGKPQAFMDSWEVVKHDDRVALWALTHPGKTGNFDVDGPIFEGRPAVIAHCKEWGIAHALCTAMISSEAGLYWVLSTYRPASFGAFAEEERQSMQLVIPHIFAAARRARIGQLRARTPAPEALGQAAAIANDNGLVLEADPGFAELVTLGWPGWAGPTLPLELSSAISRNEPVQLKRPKVLVRADHADGVVLLQARRPIAADQLSARERDVAEAFALGETHREISERLAVSPNTVRRHLANIYEKLGISSKAELERMLRA